MENIDYSVLNNVLIEDYDLIIKKYSVIYRYCLNNNIYTLGDLLLKYDNNILNIKNKKSKDEISGFIDLVKYRHFKIELPSDSILYDLIKVSKDTWNGKYKKGWSEVKFVSDYNFPLKRLGFSTYENNKLQYYVEKKGKSMIIIDALIMYKNDNEKKPLNRYKDSNEVFETKLDIIIDYYNNICNIKKSFEEQKYFELDKLLYYYKKVLEMKKDLDKQLLDIKNKINEEKYHVSNDKIKKLIKTYEVDI